MKLLSLNHIKWHLAGLSVAITVLLGILIYLSFSVRDQLALLRSTPIDNAQWTVSQFEVEFWRLHEAAILANLSSEPDLEELRKRFDLYYSRAAIVAALEAQGRMSYNADAPQIWADILAQADELAKTIDASDETLRNELARLAQTLISTAPHIRDASVDTVAFFASTSDQQRTTLASLLFQVALVAVILMGAFLLVGALLIRARMRSERVQEQLSAAKERLQSTVGAALDAVLVIDHRGDILDFNGGAEKIFGYSRDEVLGKDMARFFIPQEHRAAHRAGIRRYLKTKNSSIIGKGLVELEALRKGGERISVEVSVASVTEEGKPVFISFIRDISDRIAAQKEILNSRDEAIAANKAKSDFIALMSHEMRTPLNGLIAAHEILGATDLSEKQDRFLTIANTSGRHLMAHVNNILDITALDSKTTSQQLSPVDLAATIEDMVENLRPLACSNGNRITARVDGFPYKHLMGDQTCLNRILLNLIGNAIKFTHNGHVQIDLAVSEEQGDQVEIEIHVSDTGRGIPAGQFSRVFDDFVRLDTSLERDTEGTGLGLSISRRMAEAMGGEIGGDSVFGEGSTFWVRLPFTKPTNYDLEQLLGQKVEEASPAAPAANLQQNISALIVEDNRINREILIEYLTELGVSTASAENGELGVNLARHTAFDIIFMDISMPVMDGLDATRAIREEGASKNSRIIGFTAYSSEENLQRCIDAGLDDFVIKPVSRASVHEALLKKRSAQNRLASQDYHKLINLQQVAELRDILGPEQYKKNAEKFYQEITENLSGLKKTVLSNRGKAIANELHNMSGLAASMGAKALHQALQNAEETTVDGCIQDTLQAIIKSQLVLQETWATGELQK
ncbi:response regulator [Halocynthiibacter sp. C4]|uniref:hybrid sensor histidine kinase/response regulator n=1 Tax=Halocynthiibacter sp. C4 TaxID=2992758 RepID=UPI00237B4303|nr:PAS domain-containing hybrid sensor histidine kinase/response regulator [Halocynthiibacter sp. C4]MDE0588860.1 response regulator [Halocynthiibacter sp. C4]